MDEKEPKQKGPMIGPRRTFRPQRLSRAELVRVLFNPPSVRPSSTMAPWRGKLHRVIFEAETPAGRWFDIILLWLILAAVLVVMLESIESINQQYGTYIRAFEWAVTGLFTIEYILRLVSVRRPIRYARSFFGVVDLLSVVPTYLSLFWGGTHALAVIRVLRVLRAFRLLRLSQFVDEAEQLVTALATSFRKVTVFLFSVMTIVTIMGTLMYMIEGAEAGFDSIPRSVYWAIVTLTTVGYGDIAPQTPLGQAVSAALMILGYAIIAVPTGIVSAQLVKASKAKRQIACRVCSSEGHDPDARCCKHCGAELNG